MPKKLKTDEPAKDTAGSSPAAANTETNEPTARFMAGNSDERQQSTTTLPDMSIFYETDTGNRYRLEGSSWQWLDNIHS